LSLTLGDIARADNYFRDYIEEELIERYNVYYSSKDRYGKMFPKTHKLNPNRTFDLWSTCEWMLPDLLAAFFGSDRIISISGVGAEDADKAERIMELLQWQLTVKNPGYKTFKGWFGDALVTNLGVLKCYWKRETKDVPHQEVLNEQQLIGLMQNPANQITSSEPQPSLDAVLGLAPQTSLISWNEQVVTSNQPVIELVKPSDIRFVPDGRSLKDCSMVAHRKLVTIDFLRKEAKRGVYDPNVVEEIAQTATDYTDPTQLEIILNNAAREASQTYDQDQGRVRVILYECYSKMDINGDGILEDVIVNVCNKQLLRCVENPWGRSPLFELIPFWDNYQVWSKIGLAEIIRDVQDTHTALLKQMVYGMGVSNQVHAVVDTSTIEMQDLIDGSQFIRSKGPIGPAAMQQLQIGGLKPENFQLAEYIRTQLEQWTPMTRYNQGTDASTLNKTATGINMIMSASQARQQEIARNFAETGLSELYRFLIELNRHYMDQPQMIRLANNVIEFAPDDLNGEFDLSVDAESGVGARQARIQVLTEYMERMLPAAMQLGLAGPEQFALAGQKLLKLGGIEDAEKYVVLPDPMMQQQALMQQQMMMAQQQGGMPGAGQQQAGAGLPGNAVPQGGAGQPGPVSVGGASPILG
jgi:hypothetical protein